MVHSNAWGVTMDHSGHYCPKVVLYSKVMHEVLPWIIVDTTVQGGVMFQGNA